MPELRERLARAGARGHRALAAGIVRPGGRETGGWAADGPAPDGSRLFEIGSITKAFTGVLLADMLLRGEVALDDPLSRHLPTPRPRWRHREPTLLELATHRSALPNAPGRMGRGELAYALGLRSTDPWAGLSAREYAELVAQEHPRRPPGGRSGYSSMAVGLLGDALAQRAGTTYEELLRERVLTPLDMTGTAVTVPPQRAHALMTGHSRRGRPRPPIEDHMAAAGSLRAGVDDMLRFLAACLHPPAAPPGPALALAQRPQARITKRMEVGLCWMVLSRPGRPRVVWHNGGTWGFRSVAGFAPETGTGVVVLSSSARSVDRLGLELLEDPAGS